MLTGSYAAVIGDPVRHSLSPTIHNAAFAACGIDAQYDAVTVAVGEVDDAVARMRRERWLGMSVTMPHKESVIACLDAVTGLAERLGAVNCVFWDGDRLVGDNTDGPGVVWALTDRLGVAELGRVVVLGAGGAARACIAALAAAGAGEVVVVNRSPERAAAAAALAGSVGRVGGPSDVAGAAVVVNATPVGMSDQRGDPGGPDAAALPGPVPDRGAVALDLIYHPLRTVWLDAAEQAGARTANGVGMLVGQAAVAFERWTGVAAPVDAMWAAVSARLDSRS